MSAVIAFAIELLLFLGVSIRLLRGPRGLRWLRLSLFGLGMIVGGHLLSSVRPEVTGWLLAWPVVASLEVSTVIVALLAAAHEFRNRQEALRSALGLIAVLAVAFLVVPVPLALGAALFGWAASTIRLAVVFGRAARAHRGSLLEARLRIVTVALLMIGSAVLSALGGPFSLVWGLPMIGGSIVLWLAVAPPPFLRLVVRPTRQVLRATDQAVTRLGGASSDVSAVLSGARAVFGADAVVLYERGKVIASDGDARDVVAAAAAQPELDAESARGTERYVLTFAADRWVLAGDTGRGWLIVVLAEISLLLSSADREQIASLAERVGLALERADARRRDEQAVASLQAVERMRDDLLATLSHELRTPLTSIRGFSEVLRDHPQMLGVEQRRDLLTRIVDKSDQLERVITALLDLTAVRGRSEPERIAIYDMGDLVERAVGRARERLGTRLVVLEPVTCEVHTDGGAVLAIVDQLLDNAAKFTQATAVITLSLRVSDEDLTISCVDDGPGLADLEGGRAFEPFVRGGNVLHRETRGVGIGLSIARELARQLGGDLRSVPIDDGARFEMTMPRDHALRAAPHEAVRGSSASALEDPTLLPSAASSSRRQVPA